ALEPAGEEDPLLGRHRGGAAGARDPGERHPPPAQEAAPLGAARRVRGHGQRARHLPGPDPPRRRHRAERAGARVGRRAARGPAARQGRGQGVDAERLGGAGGRGDGAGAPRRLPPLGPDRVDPRRLLVPRARQALALPPGRPHPPRPLAHGNVPVRPPHLGPPPPAAARREL
ncbi:MAG: hypothetical protein AVDCRST_MAG68-815, partial [uncultured Gemmatimonadetes bacterium]